jgi:murein DD-endopeptidase MepM/ murein hydrolase activator NlpD
VLVRDAYMSGKTVLLWHGADVYTAYFHLDRVAVKQGATVRRGQRIGTLGRSGRVTGPHLHWSAKVGGLYVDPEALLAIDFAAGEAPPRAPRADPAAPAPPAPMEGPDAPPPAVEQGEAAGAAVTPAEAAPAPSR